MRLRSVFLCLVLGCSGEEAPPPAPALDRSPAEVPDDVIAEVAADGPLRAEGDVFARFLAQFVPFPPTVGEPEGDLHALVFEGGARAAAVDVVAPPSGGIEGGPRGARFVDASRTCAVADRRAVCATSTEALRDAFAYLAFGELPGDAPMRGRLAAGQAGRMLRPTVASTWAEYRRDAERTIARETAERGEWDYADPNAVLAAVDEFVGDVLAYVPDIGAITFTIEETAWGRHVRFVLPVEPESPLAEWQANHRPQPLDVDDLPVETAAFVWRATPFDWPSLLRETTGGRLAALEGPGSHHVAVGGDAGRSFFELGPAGSVPPVGPGAWRLRHTALLLEGLFGCPEPGPRGTPLCASTEGRRPVWRTGAPALRFVRGAAADAPGRTLATDPDARRLLPREALAVVYVDMRHAPGAARMFRADDRVPSEPGPLLISLEEEDRGLVLNVRATPGSLALLAPLLTP